MGDIQEEDIAELISAIKQESIDELYKMCPQLKKDFIVMSYENTVEKNYEMN